VHGKEGLMATIPIHNQRTAYAVIDLHVTPATKLQDELNALGAAGYAVLHVSEQRIILWKVTGMEQLLVDVPNAPPQAIRPAEGIVRGFEPRR